MKPEEIHDERIAEKAAIIEAMEDFIDGGLPLYLITWSPNPAELPDADFRVQHEFFVSLLTDYLKCCHAGVFCVEATQAGNPHYHGWYQVDEDKELMRVAMKKTMDRFGNTRITKCKVSYKINEYSSKGNALWYYKKDIASCMLPIDINPVTKYSESTIDWDSILVKNFFTKEIKNPQMIEEKISAVKFAKDFYVNSL